MMLQSDLHYYLSLSHRLIWSSFSTSETPVAIWQGAASMAGSSCPLGRARAEQHKGWGDGGKKLQKRRITICLSKKMG